ncbi:hypothetical protein DPEC_G00248120 [Dallia pectoralis]|uniref:Uncharacterized protein n=1 Tax=Dallia pectoralis TaxID=75939 RepID=A0ACC2FWK4_DALPE|nr:hypothetical protein DPEC_G00248120 [Dallia pectoralis]
MREPLDSPIEEIVLNREGCLDMEDSIGCSGSSVKSDHDILLGSLVTYEEARLKLPEAERFTDLTDSEDSPLKRRRRRMKKNVVLEEEDSETSPTAVNVGSSGNERTAVSESFSGGNTTPSQARTDHSGILINKRPQLHQLVPKMQTSVNTMTLAQRGGTAVKDTVWRMMGYLLTNELARQMNWKGANGKAAFKNLILRGIINARISEVLGKRRTLVSEENAHLISQLIQTAQHIAPRYPADFCVEQQALVL